MAGITTRQAWRTPRLLLMNFRKFSKHQRQQRVILKIITITYRWIVLGQGGPKDFIVSLHGES